jgi:hypothetical protein
MAGNQLMSTTLPISAGFTAKADIRCNQYTKAGQMAQPQD